MKQTRPLTQRYGEAIESVRTWSPAVALVIENYVAKLRQEAAARRVQARDEAADQPHEQEVTG